MKKSLSGHFIALLTMLTLAVAQPTIGAAAPDEAAPSGPRIEVVEREIDLGVINKGGLYELNCDFYDKSLEKAIGRKGGLLKQAYAAEKTRIEARKKGYSVIERHTKNGIRLHVRIP